MKCRFVEAVGERAWLSLTWDNDCPNSFGGARPGAHYVRKQLADGHKDAYNDFVGTLAEWEHRSAEWPDACAHCDRQVPKDTPDAVALSLVYKRLFNTMSGEPEPGDMYWGTGAHAGGKCYYWDNCTGSHLMVVLPNGHHWDIDSRASNCDMKDERTHRCWVRHGEPPNVHVDKAGHTCHAGAGSIAHGDFHGYLHSGELTDC